MAISNGIVDIKPTLPVDLNAILSIYRASSPGTIPTISESIYSGELSRSGSFVATGGDIYIIAVNGLASQYYRYAQVELSLLIAAANDRFDDRFVLPPNAV